MELISRGRVVAVALVVCLVLLAGCARKRVTVERWSPSAGSPTWTGRSVDEVLATWGKSAERKPDGESGWILTYYSDRDYSCCRQTIPPSPTGMSGLPGGGTPASDADPPMPGASWVDLSEPMARFWIGADGLVYRFWFAGKVYRKGRHQPPSTVNEPEPESP